MKKINLFIFLIIAVLQSTAMAETLVKTGNYIQLGVYRDEPLIWRCAGEDENGLLMFNNAILCYKSFDAKGSNNFAEEDKDITNFGSSLWSQSNIRAWLNSDTNSVIYPCENPPKAENVWLTYNAYADEAGFLTNFTDNEKTVIKTVKLKTPLYNLYKGVADGTYKTFLFDSEMTTHELECDFQYTDDKIFLLDCEQLNMAINNLETAFCMTGVTSTASCGEYANLSTSMTENYWLRSPGLLPFVNETYSDLRGSNVAKLTCRMDFSDFVPYGYGSAYMSYGIRPAFYLSDVAEFVSGDGTAENPYIVSPTGATKKHILYVWKTEYDEYKVDGELMYVIDARVDGKLIDFPDAKPFIDESNRTQVPIRAVAEMMNADVGWDGETRTVTISKDGKVIKIVIDSDTITVDGKAVKMDTSALIKDDRTYIPVRFVAEALGLTVEWVNG